MTACPMRVTVVSPPPNFSGGVRVIAVYAAALAARGHRVKLVTVPWRQRDLKWKLRDWSRGKFATRRAGPSHLDGLDVERVDLTEPSQLTADRLGEADVLVTTLWTTALRCAGLPERCGRQVHFVQHDERVVTPMLAGEVEQAWRLPGRRVVVAEWLARVARDEFGHGDVHVCANGVDMDLFSVGPGGEERSRTVGVMYSDAAFKGTDVALAAVRAHRSRNGNDALRLIGFGHETPSGADAGLFDGFEHRPAQGRIAELYRSCDAWLYPSRCEGFGLPVLEAMACGTPVIGTEAGVGAEAIEPGGGWLVPIDDAEAMGGALDALAAMDDAALAERGAAARRVAEGYGWPAACARFESLLAEAVGDGGVGSAEARRGVA
ncbi:MAG: glycosyltransferase family 4 protein [Planctomycetota bacterium]